MLIGLSLWRKFIIRILLLNSLTIKPNALSSVMKSEIVCPWMNLSLDLDHCLLQWSTKTCSMFNTLISIVNYIMTHIMMKVLFRNKAAMKTSLLLWNELCCSLFMFFLNTPNLKQSDWLSIIMLYSAPIPDMNISLFMFYYWLKFQKKSSSIEKSLMVCEF